MRLVSRADSGRPSDRAPGRRGRAPEPRFVTAAEWWYSLFPRCSPELIRWEDHEGHGQLDRDADL